VLPPSVDTHEAAYPVIELPPSLGGVEKETDTVAPVNDAAADEGASGTLAGTKLVDASDASPDPFAFCAVTVHAYVFPFVSPETAIGLAEPPAEPAVPPSEETHDAA
jgi:hypothetical protein